MTDIGTVASLVQGAVMVAIFRFITLLDIHVNKISLHTHTHIYIYRCIYIKIYSYFTCCDEE